MEKPCGRRLPLRFGLIVVLMFTTAGLLSRASSVKSGKPVIAAALSSVTLRRPVRMRKVGNFMMFICLRGAAYGCRDLLYGR